MPVPKTLSLKGVATIQELLPGGYKFLVTAGSVLGVDAELPAGARIPGISLLNDSRVCQTFEVEAELSAKGGELDLSITKIVKFLG